MLGLGVEKWGFGIVLIGVSGGLITIQAIISLQGLQYQQRVNRDPQRQDAYGLNILLGVGIIGVGCLQRTVS